MSESSYGPLHRALGLPAGPITEAMIDLAVASGVIEAIDLDWKRDLPHESNQRWQLEFSKDVAAMANSRGGIIVFGVGEDGRTTAASERRNVDISAAVQQRLRAAAHAYIRPYVSGITFDAVPSVGTEGTGTLVVHIPASSDAPHQFGIDGTVPAAFPYRNGPETQFFKEFEIDRAYHERSTRAIEVRDRAATVQASTREVLPGAVGPWIIFTATPVRHGIVPLGTMDRATLKQLFLDARALSGSLIGADSDKRIFNLDQSRLGGGSRFTRRYKKWVLENAAFNEHLRLEIHDDATVVLAVNSGGGEVAYSPNHPANYQHMPIHRIESLIIDGFALASSAALRLNRSEKWIALFDFARSPKETKLIVTTFVWSGAPYGGGFGGALEMQRDSEPLEARFEAVDVAVSLPAHQDDMGVAILNMAMDALNQSSVETGVVLPKGAEMAVELDR